MRKDRKRKGTSRERMREVIKRDTETKRNRAQKELDTEKNRMRGDIERGQVWDTVRRRTREEMKGGH